MRVRHDTVHFRPASLADAPNIRALQDASLRVLAGKDYEPHEIAGFIEKVGTLDLASLTEGRYAVAEIDGEIVASAGWKPDGAGHELIQQEPRKSGKTASFATLHGIYVDPSLVRLGLATRALSYIEAQTLEHGHIGIVTVTAYAAMPFLTRMGFRPAQLVRLDLQDGRAFNGVEMRKHFTRVFRPALRHAA